MNYFNPSSYLDPKVCKMMAPITQRLFFTSVRVKSLTRLYRDQGSYRTVIEGLLGITYNEFDHSSMGDCQNQGPFLVLGIVRNLVFRGPKGDPSFNNHPHTLGNFWEAYG